jgi:hypothetical protein
VLGQSWLTSIASMRAPPPFARVAALHYASDASKSACTRAANGENDEALVSSDLLILLSIAAVINCIVITAQGGSLGIFLLLALSPLHLHSAHTTNDMKS